MFCQPKVKQRFSLHCRCFFGAGKTCVFMFILPWLPSLSLWHTYSLKDLGEKKKQPFMPQPLNGLESTWQLGKQNIRTPTEDACNAA